MRRSMAIVIAGMLAFDSHSTNLHVHLFEPTKLKNTYIPGFLVSKTLQVIHSLASLLG